MENILYDFEDYEYCPTNVEEISESITQNWTQQALECYELNGNCRECSIKKGHYSFICQMPRVIETLLNTVGIPEQARKTA